MRNIKDKDIYKILIFIFFAIVMFIVVVLINIRNIKKVMNINTGEKVNLSVPVSTTEEDSEEKDDEIIPEEDIKTNSIKLKLLINNGWDRVKAKFSSGYIIDENGNYVHDEGFTLYCESTNVKNIIFNSKYQDNVIGGLKVGATQKEIKDVLGEPTFENEELEMIGYKTKELYAFFYEDEISIYPNRDLRNSSFESLLFNYYLGGYSGTRTDFVIEVKREYPDFVAESDGTDVILYSFNRQIEIRLPEDKTATIIIYNGYEIQNLMEYYLENEPDKVKKEKDDLVEIKEIERVEAK